MSPWVDADTRSGRWVDAPEEPETTVGGVGRMFAGGAVRGAAALPELAGQAIGGAGRLINRGLEYAGVPESIRGGRGVEAAAGALQRGSRAVGEFGQNLAVGDDPSVGDTALERMAGAVGEVTGATVAGGGGLAAMRGAGMLAPAVRSAAKRAAIVAPSTAGAGLGLGVAREAAPDSVAAEVAGSIGGGVAGALIGGAVRASAAGVKAFRDKGTIEEIAPYKRAAARDVEIEGVKDELGAAYDELSDIASSRGVTFNAKPFRAAVARVKNELESTEGRAMAKDFFSRLQNLPDRVSYKILRGHQMAVNRELAATRKRGGKRYALQRLSNVIADELKKVAKSEEARAAGIAEDLTSLNAQWARAVRMEMSTDTQRNLLERMLRTDKGRVKLKPGFQDWFRGKKARQLFTEEFGKEHYDNMAVVIRNRHKIPTEVVQDVAGMVDEQAGATREFIKGLGQVATAPIGSIKFRGRRVAQMAADMASSIHESQQAVTVAEALLNPDLAAQLAGHLSGEIRRQAERITGGRAATLLAPALSGE